MRKLIKGTFWLNSLVRKDQVRRGLTCIQGPNIIASVVVQTMIGVLVLHKVFQFQGVEMNRFRECVNKRLNEIKNGSDKKRKNRNENEWQRSHKYCMHSLCATKCSQILGAIFHSYLLHVFVRRTPHNQKMLTAVYSAYSRSEECEAEL